MAAHATLGASSAKRWMNCPGSVRLSADRPNNTTVWAAEGTAAHELGEMCLLDPTQENTPRDWAGSKIKVDKDGGHWEFEVNDNMIEAVTVYVDYVREIMEPGDQLMVEARVALSGMGEPGDDMFGTSDTVLYRPSTRELWVIDYKHGSGVSVDVTDNPQLLYYGVGSCLLLRQPVVTCHLVVVQPRAPHKDGPIRSQSIGAVELMEWGMNELMPAARKTQAPDAALVVSEECRFCRAAAVCPQLQKEALERAMLEFDEENKTVTPKAEPEELTTDQLVTILDNAPLITAWINACQKYAHDELESGRDKTNGAYKLVAKRPQRKWKSEEGAADTLCMSYGLGDDELFEAPKMKSPAKVEEALKATVGSLPRKDAAARKKEFKKFIDGLVSAESSGNTLAPAHDKRPAVTTGPTDDFND